MTLNITTLRNGSLSIGNERGGILFLNKGEGGVWAFGVHPDKPGHALVTFTDEELQEAIGAMASHVADAETP